MLCALALAADVLRPGATREPAGSLAELLGGREMIS